MQLLPGHSIHIKNAKINYEEYFPLKPWLTKMIFFVLLFFLGINQNNFASQITIKEGFEKYCSYIAHGYLVNKKIISEARKIMTLEEKKK